jgi:hypothetical protein
MKWRNVEPTALPEGDALDADLAWRLAEMQKVLREFPGIRIESDYNNWLFKRDAALASANKSQGERMNRLSTGQASTLGSYRRIAKIFFSDKAVAYLDQKIKESPNGENEEVIADETQMFHLLASM